MATIADICKIIPAEIDTDYSYVGVRIVANDYDDYTAKIGDILPTSFVWDNGEQTDEELNGTCCLDIDQLWDIKNPSNHNGYYGDRVLIIGGNSVEYGNDPYEIIIKDAEVLDIINI